MKPILFFITLLLHVIFSFAQIDPTAPWTWMKGDNTIDQKAVYGTQGIAHPDNKPGARNFSTTWRDNNGNLWLFGGMGYETDNLGYLNDLWKYDPYSNNWTWMKGDNSTEQFSVYGTVGIANTANKPGATYSGSSWTDASGNLWLFGGFGYTHDAFGFINSLWKYNPALNQWTWVKGDQTIDQTGTYGTKGMANTLNKPGGRYGSQTWTDANGQFWLYGGYGFGNNTTSGVLNDLWKFNPATNQWTWISGDKTVDQPGVYGMKGIANAANKPGARYLSTTWTDQNDNLWLFGGYGVDENSEGSLNDLWKYNPSANEWTWMNGDKIVDQKAVYGTRGLSCATNKPGARYVSNCWADPYGKFWLFGGYGFDGENQGYLNGLWKYDPVTNFWCWIKGDSIVGQSGIYGTMGMPDPTNKSGARTGSVSWTDGNGNLWLFGGYGFDGSTSGILNDLWRISSMQVVLPLHLLQFTGTLKNEIARLQWQTEQETGFSHYAIQRSFDGTSFNTIGMVHGTGSNTRNEYHFDDADLANRKEKSVFYRLQLLDTDGHFTYSSVIKFDLVKNDISFVLYPNPAMELINLSFVQPDKGNVTINIFAVNGKTVKQLTKNVAAGRAGISLDVHTLPAGTYILTLSNDAGISRQTFIKQQ